MIEVEEDIIISVVLIVDAAVMGIVEEGIQAWVWRSQCTLNKQHMRGVNVSIFKLLKLVLLL